MCCQTCCVRETVEMTDFKTGNLGLNDPCFESAEFITPGSFYRVYMCVYNQHVYVTVCTYCYVNYPEMTLKV